MRIQCHKCKRQVDLSVFDTNPGGNNVTVRVECHGQVEVTGMHKSTFDEMERQGWPPAFDDTDSRGVGP